ncbi:granzyme H-like isoform X2 [Equus przewalskii]|uniref:Granzyme H-like isoform X2 n=1 Tax=Equus przewalskii TaxID=9798 RepID=A0ABM4Q3M2_EQUPR
MQPLLLLLAFLMPPEPGTGIITGGHEAKPHSRPYMALIHYLVEETPNRCGGVLVRKDFVLTAAHCWGSSVNVVALGVHNIQQQESTWQVIPVKEAIHHPDYNPQNFSNDIMLIKLERKAMQTAAVRTLSLPWGKAQGDSGGPLVCENVAHGIASYGQNNGTPPTVFMKVSHYMPWIKRTMKLFP